ncbi:MAG: NADPH:quinone oxidoreductase family protein [Candidatus Dormibacteria bacterium]
MRAWVVHQNGPPQTMRLEDLPEPALRPELVRISVAAAAVNFFDSLMVAGTYQVRPELPFIPGSEVAGVVVAAPPASGLQAGQRVMARVSQSGLSGGGYTQLTDARPENVVAMPEAMPFDEAAALFINYQTGWFGLHRRAHLRPQEVLLVHAGAGGVGSAAIQLGKAAGARVIATAGSPAKLEVCRSLGADLAINYRDQDFVERVRADTEGHGADVVYDPVGGEVLRASTRCLAFEGRLICVGFTSGDIPQLRANHLLIKNYSVMGLHWGLYADRRPQLVKECTAELLRLYGDGRIKPYVSSQVPLAGAADALDAVVSRQTTGKVVLRLEDRPGG